ncbi:hypothetical protein LEP1GSC127_0058 [Leptospira kirschneri str. 200801925]|nr:hypothetical protein LEP1GSC127_0058 [Leptospira kirschneri str. 200801925]
MIIPKTKDGRVVFIIPWEDHVILGTTDTPIENPGEEPLPIGNEVQFYWILGMNIWKIQSLKKIFFPCL